MTIAHSTYTTGRYWRVPVSIRVYSRRTASKRRLTTPANPFSASPERSRREPIIGDRVRATTPETMTAPASVKANSRKSAPVRPPWKPIGAYTAASVIVMAMIGPRSSRAALIAASNGFSPSWRWRSTFSTMTMASSTTRPTERTIASSVSRLIVKPGDEHQEHGADERDRDRDDRDQHGAERAEEQEDHDDDDDERLGQGLQDLVDRLLDVERRVVRDARRHAGRQLRLNLLQLRAHALDDVERVRGRQAPDAHEGGGLAVEPDVLVVGLGAEHDVRDLLEPDDVALLLLDHQLLEVLGRLEAGVRDEVDRHHRALRRPERREVVVGGQQVPHLGRRDPERRHPLGLQPDAHREDARAQDVGLLHAGDGRQLRLHDARQVVGDLVLVELLRGKPDVHGGELRVGRLRGR